MTSESGSTLTAATDQSLCSFIRSARRRLVVLAPALSMPVAEAVAERWKELLPPAVSVTLDVDAEVYRLGYGDPKALVFLERAGAELGTLLNRHEGIRIGVIIADDQLIVYSPVPALIEAGARTASAPNALLLGAPSEDLKNALGVGESRSAAQTVGLDKATVDEIVSVQKDLEANPPQRFDVARRVRVFNAAFQFVELEMNGTNMARRRVQIPNYLFGVADEKTREQLRTSLGIVPPGHDLGGAQLNGFRGRLQREFLKSIPSHGQALLRQRKAGFEKGVALLRARVESFKNTVRQKLAPELAARITEMEAALLPRLLEAPPTEWLLPDEEPERGTAIRQELHLELERIIGTPDDYVGDMEVRVVFKDVTHESLTNEAFLKAALKVFPELERLHSEFDAAPGESSIQE